ncbi:amidase [Rhodanobacter sp. DHG33]|uniref:amidase n=1 Tax=Rhodanobacter sp. DHG33 TaxID=2775921 RepID=UPI001786BF72|nr:amidase [Rhodanobacter sp. DHG33]MBD8899380.1 amidase [Rhodanobacter sp. DHG33]
MTRRPFACSLLAAALLASMPLAAQQHDDDYASIAQLQQRMDDGSLDSKALTRDFLARIQRIDRNGPALRSVLQTNPDALKIAAALDAKRTKQHGPLYGIPVLLKDNIDTGDREQTTAGSLALAGAPAPHDATVTAKLRAAGALILGKTNLSEWADYRSNHASSGWSGVGGQTRNPYALDRNPCGSSAGSAAAVAAGLATVAIGTETDGSIICPSSMTDLVGIKPTLGLVSRAGIVPISANQDTAGPIARDVADAAALLSVIAGSDPRDPATADAGQHATDYTKFLDPNGLRGKRIGVVRALGGIEPNADRVLDDAIAAMKAQGAIIVDPVQVPHINELSDAESTVMQYDFKHDINAYLATRTGLKVHTLADLIAFDNAHAAEEMPWFGQEIFEQSQARGPLTDQAYRDALAKAKRFSGPEGIDAALQSQHLDALLAPSWGPAFTTDLVLGDHVVSGDPNIGGPSQPAAVAGYPSITLPAGWAHGLPVGIVLFGAKWSEPTLISIAYGFEQHTHAWQPPKFLDTVDGKPVMASSK